MPQKMEIKEIAEKNPNVDLEKLAEWARLRKDLLEGGFTEKRERNSASIRDERAKIVDDAENDPRLVRLHR